MFLRRGEARFKSRLPSIEFKIYDLERESAQNGLAAGAADIVVATNVLHATTSIAGTLERLGRALAPGGLLVINEVTARQTFGTLVFGLTEGWWRGAAEADRIPGSPLVDRATWQRLLSEADFEIVGSHAIELGDLEAQSVIVARLRGQGVAKTASRPAGTAAPLPAEALLPHLRALFSDVLKVDPAELRQDETFERYGLESLSAVEIRDRLERDVPGLPATLLFEHNTLGRLARHLVEAHPGSVARLVGEPAAIAPGPAPAAPVPGPAAAAPQREVSSASLEPIAVIGMAGRYPGGETLEAFWQTLVEGRSAITEVPPERWNVAATFRPEGGGEDAAYTKWAGFVGDIDKFDPLFFRLAPLEAEVMDPQERLFLETAWAAVEDAGYTPERLKASAADETGEAGDVGVFVGVMNGAYQWLAAEAWASGQTGGGASSYWSIANRVSYLLDLTGPSMVVDTACSASLSALHLACEAIRRGDCRAAIVGGVNLIIHPRQLVNLSQAGMVSRGRRVPGFRRGRRWLRRWRGCGRCRAQAAVAGRAGRRPDRGADSRDGRQRGRQDRGLHRPEPRRAGRGGPRGRCGAPASTPARSTPSRRMARARRWAIRSRSRGFGRRWPDVQVSPA